MEKVGQRNALERKCKGLPRMSLRSRGLYVPRISSECTDSTASHFINLPINPIVFAFRRLVSKILDYFGSSLTLTKLLSIFVRRYGNSH
jgi:hypothetical protein